MKFSVRTRLTFWYVTLLTVSLFLFGASLFYALDKSYMSRVDKEISTVSGMFVHAIVKPTGELSLPPNFDLIFERFFGIKTGGYYIQVADSNGKAAARSYTLGKKELPVSDATRARAAKGDMTFETTRKFSTYPIRMVTRPVITRDHGFIGMVQVGASLEGMEEIFHYMIYFFFVSAAVSLIVAGIVGWFLAKTALKPVSEITRTARRISVERLDQRIDMAGSPKDEIVMLAATFNDMISRLERSFKQIKQFTGDASHELKTPLTIVKGEIEVALKRDKSKEEFREVLESTLEEIDRMNYIVKTLLDAARTEVEAGSAPQTLVRLDAVVAERFEQSRKMAAEKGVVISIEENATVMMVGDPVRVGQVVFNLIDNAIKYTNPGGSVQVSLIEEGGTAVLSVRDTGVGIAAPELPHIFDRFYRVDKSRTRGHGGFGLGLSICKDIVETYGGTLEVSSEPGRGTEFIVKFKTAVVISGEAP